MTETRTFSPLIELAILRQYEFPPNPEEKGCWKQILDALDTYEIVLRKKEGINKK